MTETQQPVPDPPADGITRRTWRGVLLILRWPPRLLTGAMTFLAIMLLLRLLLVTCYPADFSELSGRETLGAIIYGMRFDLATFSLLLAPVLWILAMPLPWAARGWWRWPLTAVGALILGVVLVVEIGSLIYFGHVHRRPGGEVFATSAGATDVAFMTSMAFGPYLWATLAGLVGIATAVLAWCLIAAAPAPPVQGRKSITIVVVLFTLVVPSLIVIGARGGLQRKPLAPASVFQGQDFAGGIISGNSTYQLLHIWRRGQGDLPHFMPAEQATQAITALQPGSPIDPEFPLLRRFAAERPQLPDVRKVLFVIMEGWDGDAVDAIRTAHGKAPMGLTPRFDALAERGWLLTNHYATGQRSNQGIAGILSGLPVVPELPMIGFGLAQNRMRTLGTIATDRGAATFFLRAARRHSFRLDAVMPRLGFEHYEGSEDIHPAGLTAPHGVWDHELFDRLFEVATSTTGPAIGACFTLATHGPWAVPDEKWERLPHIGDRDRYLNSLHYSDAALGDFMDRFLAHPASADTLVVIVSDHCVGQVERDADDPLGVFRIPALLIGPGIEPRVDDRITSQLDWVPTVLDVMGWSAEHHALGRSLFDQNGGRSAIACLEPTLTAIDGAGQSTIAGGQILSTDHDPDTALGYRTALLALYQTMHALNASNRFAPEAP